MSLGFFLGDGLRRQTEDELALVVGAQADPVSVGQHADLGRLSIDEDAAALPAIFNENARSCYGDSGALARDTKVVERQVVAVILTPSDQERQLIDGNDLDGLLRKDDL